MPAKDNIRFRNLPKSGTGHRQRGTLFIWMAALFAAVVLTACVIVNPPPAPTPQPTAAPAQQPPATPTPPPAPARAAAVDFSLPSAQGPQYTLSSFAGQQPVVVVFYRAFW